MERCDWCGRVIEKDRASFSLWINTSHKIFCSEKCKQAYYDEKSGRRERELKLEEKKVAEARALREAQEKRDKEELQLKSEALELEREKERARRREFEEERKQWEADPDNWTGEKWASHLRFHPEDAFRCDWSKMRGADMVRVLIMHPEMSNRCDWEERMTGTDWSELLSCQPAFSNICNWDSLYGEDWAALLSRRPQFADECDWRCLKGADWSNLLLEQPQFANKCNWDLLDGKDWSRLLSSQPQLANECNWDLLDCKDWSKILSCQPQFNDKCNKWDDFNGREFCDILCGNPYVCNRSLKWIEHFNRFNEYWVELLKFQPDFSVVLERVYSWERLCSSVSFAKLLAAQPQFADKCNLYRIDIFDEENEWEELLDDMRKKYREYEARKDDFAPKYLEYITKLENAYEEKLEELKSVDGIKLYKKEVWKEDKDAKAELLSNYPGWSVWMLGIEWKEFEDYNWATILEKQPQFANECDKYDGWEKLYGDSDPQEPLKCYWGDLLNAQPQLVNRFDIKELISTYESWYSHSELPDDFDWTGELLGCPAALAAYIASGEYAKRSVYNVALGKYVKISENVKKSDAFWDGLTGDQRVVMLKSFPKEVSEIFLKENGFINFTTSHWDELIEFDSYFAEVYERAHGESARGESDAPEKNQEESSIQEENDKKKKEIRKGLFLTVKSLLLFLCMQGQSAVGAAQKAIVEFPWECRVLRKLVKIQEWVFVSLLCALFRVAVICGGYAGWRKFLTDNQLPATDLHTICGAYLIVSYALRDAYRKQWIWYVMMVPAASAIVYLMAFSLLPAEVGAYATICFLFTTIGTTYFMRKLVWHLQGGTLMFAVLGVAVGILGAPASYLELVQIPWIVHGVYGSIILFLAYKIGKQCCYMHTGCRKSWQITFGMLLLILALGVIWFFVGGGNDVSLIATAREIVSKTF